MNQYDPYSTDLTEEEKRLLKQYNDAQNFGAIGSTVGTVAGTGLSFIPPLTPFAGAIIPAAGALGGLIGGGIGGSQQEAALRALEKERMKSEKASTEQQARMEAFNRLLGRYQMPGAEY